MPADETYAKLRQSSAAQPSPTSGGRKDGRKVAPGSTGRSPSQAAKEKQTPVVADIKFLNMHKE